MWDERVVAAIVKAAREDLQQQKWARDFADKLRQRGITTEQVLRTASLQSFIVLYWHKGRAAIGFWHPDIRLVAVWSPLRKGRWVTAF
jgi:hypothetical protein